MQPRIEFVAKKLFQRTPDRHAYLPVTRPLPYVSWSAQLALLAAIATSCMGYNLSVFNTPFATVTEDFGWCGSAYPNPSDPTIIHVRSGCSNALEKQTLINGSFILCCAVGSLLSGPAMRRWGRRSALMIVYAVYCVAVGLGSLAWHFEQLTISRMVAGIASGMSTVIPGVYMTEMAPPSLRPAFSVIPQISINVGILFGICMGLPLRVPRLIDFGEDDFGLLVSEWLFNRIWWRVMLAAVGPLCLGAFILLLRPYAFETPAYLRLLGHTQAASALETLLFDETSPSGSKIKVAALTATSPSSSSPSTTDNSTRQQQSSMASSVTSDNALHKREGMDTTVQAAAETATLGSDDDIELTVLTGPAADTPSSLLPVAPPTIPLGRALLSHPTLRYRLLVGWFLAMAQQLTGINVFMATSNSIFASAGVPFEKLTLASVAMAAFGVLCVIFAPSLLAQMHRRTMLFGGAALMALSFMPVLLCALFLPDYSPIHQFLAVVCTLLFIAAYNGSFGPGLFLYLNELLPIEVKDSGLAIAFTLNWLTGFALVSSAPFLSQRQCFTVFAIFCSFSSIFAYCFAPETKTSLRRTNSPPVTVVQADDDDDDAAAHSSVP